MLFTKTLTKLLAAFALGVLPIPNSGPGDTTQIYVAYANGVDKPMVNETTADAEVSVDVTVQKPDGSTVDINVKSTIVRNQTTRRQLAADIAAKLRDKLAGEGLSPDLVDHQGAGVTVMNTPKGVGKNKGTPKEPLKSPPKATNSHGHIETTTTDKDGK
jgi:hypothetical protein